MMKKVGMLLLSLALVVSVLGIASSVSAASHGKQGVLQSVEGYTQHLGELAKHDQEANQLLKEFKALDRVKQEKLIQYLNDPELFRALIEKSNALNAGESVALKNGDVLIRKDLTITVDEGVEEVPDLQATYYRRATYTVTQEIFGLKITKLSSYVRYTHNGYRVTSTYGNGAYVTNYNFGVKITKDVRSHYHTSVRAYSTTIWEGAFARWTPIVVSKEQKVWGTYWNTAGGYLINL
ncbi:hypothetical protein [Lentibacillus saliphilus]|uniref:hypothetical protein n=1 Tax=Lentibacillus saliphilus TaxID=2737028 RepID=UPI001C2FC9D0|nr:hypothetical protein [Lentibacillus saliphilus]